MSRAHFIIQRMHLHTSCRRAVGMQKDSNNYNNNNNENENENNVQKNCLNYIKTTPAT